MAIDNRPWDETAPGEARDPKASSQAAAGERAASMDRYLFFGRVIDAIAQGAAFRACFSRFLKIAAAGVAFSGLVALFHAWQFTSRQQPPGIAGGIVYMLFLAAGIYMVVHAAVIRAGHIASLPDGEFTLIPLCAVLCLLAGEAYAAFCASVSIGGGVLIWFIRGDAYNLLKDVSAFLPSFRGTDFLGGILFMIRGLFRAALVLTGGYLASELLLVAGKLGERAQEASGASANRE